MSKKLVLTTISICAAIFLLVNINGCDTQNSSKGNHESGHHKGQVQEKEFRGYPDFGAMMSNEDFAKQFPGQKMFSLSQDYPKTKPNPNSMAPFFNIPWEDRATFMDWIMAVREHCFEGMIDVDFIPQKNKVRDWYHMPFLHYGDLASEGFHGLAKEASISPYQLGPNQSKGGQTYAIGFYNDFAGNILHKMWIEQDNPDGTATNAPDGGGFPEGTVIFKLLFTDLDETQVDYLKNPFSWDAWVTEYWDNKTAIAAHPERKNWANPNPRVVKKMSLIQMDLMVRDKRADKYGTGWVFGTFCYNGNLNNGKPMKERVKNLVPVGIQFGNDPDYKTNWFTSYPPLETKINDSLQQTFINPSPDLPPQHLGYGGRLDGPVDLNTASCMSCHATAEFPQVAALVPPQAFIGENKAYKGDSILWKLTDTNAPAFQKYFDNLRCGTAYTPDKAASTDFSLQVSLALGYYYDWKDGTFGGIYSKNYNENVKPVRRGGT